jgi:sugar phosphate permease
MKVTRVHYAWVVAAVTFCVLLTAAGIRSAPGVLMVPLQVEFGWSRATISFAVALNIFLYGLAGPFAAAILGRFGLRRTIIVALAVISSGVALTPFMQESWQLALLWGVVVGSGSGVTALVLGATVAARWFERQRGLVVGVLTASTATGQLVFLPLFAALLEAHGWRSVSLTIASVAALMIIPVALLMRDYPADLQLPPYGGPRVVAPPATAAKPFRRAAVALREACGYRNFWLLSGSFFICGASTNGVIGTHLISACLDHGIPEVAGASLLAAMGIFDFFGTTLSGWLSDRIDGRKLLAWYYGLRGLSLIFLPFTFQYSFYGLGIFAVFYGLDWIATVPPTVRLTAETFGEQNVGIYFGWIAATHQLGAAFAAWMAGVLRSSTGDYLSAFMSAGALCLAASIMVTFIGRTQTRPVHV